MENYTILGHHNFGLSLLIENLRSMHQSTVHVDIVSNMAEAENALRSFPFDAPDITIKVWPYDQWAPKPGHYLNSGMSGTSRRRIFEFFYERFGIERSRYVHCVHETSVIASSARVGDALHMGPNSTIAAHAQLGDFVLLNRNSSVGHHVRIDDFVNVGCGCHVGSQTHLGEGVIIGLGASVFDKVRIGKNTVIGAGAVVTKDVPDNVVAYGVPAKVIRAIGD